MEMPEEERLNGPFICKLILFVDAKPTLDRAEPRADDLESLHIHLITVEY